MKTTAFNKQGKKVSVSIPVEKTFTLISCIADAKNNVEYHYQDDEKKSIVFIETNRAWVYMHDNEKTHVDYRSKKIINKLIEGYQENSMNRQNFKGGYTEAISKVTITI